MDDVTRSKFVSLMTVAVEIANKKSDMWVR